MSGEREKVAGKAATLEGTFRTCCVKRSGANVMCILYMHITFKSRGRRKFLIILSGRLKQLRKEHHLTQQNVADRLGVKMRTYQYYESDTDTAHRPDLEALVVLADLYGVSVDYLISGTDISQAAASDDRSRRNRSLEAGQDLSGEKISKFSERLLLLRKEKNLRQEDVLEEFGLSIRTYRRYETGVSEEVGLPALWRIADFYGVSIDYLVGRTDTR